MSLFLLLMIPLWLGMLACCALVALATLLVVPAWAMPPDGNRDARKED
jgi:hypothetical protein